MKTDRIDWGKGLNDLAGEHAALITDYERDMIERRCVVEVTAGELSWKRHGKERRWRIFRGERPLVEVPVSERVQYGIGDLEKLADAADSAMSKLMTTAARATEAIEK